MEVMKHGTIHRRVRGVFYLATVLLPLSIFISYAAVGHDTLASGLVVVLSAVLLLCALVLWREKVPWAHLGGVVAIVGTAVGIQLLNKMSLLDIGIGFAFEPIGFVALGVVMSTWVVGMMAHGGRRFLAGLISYATILGIFIASIIDMLGFAVVLDTSIYVLLGLATVIVAHQLSVATVFYERLAAGVALTVAFLLQVGNHDVHTALLSLSAMVVWALVATHAATRMRITILISAFVLIALVVLGPSLGIGYVGSKEEIRPTFVSTMHVFAEGVLAHPASLWHGTGSFEYSWNKYRPTVINQTPLWDADMVYGVGLLPTYTIIYGLPFVLALIALYGGALVQVIRSVSAQSPESSLHLVVLLLGGAAVIYTIPSLVFLAITAFCLGLFYESPKRKRLHTAYVARVETAMVGSLAVYAVALITIAVMQLGAIYWYDRAIRASVSSSDNDLVMHNLERSLAWRPTNEALQLITRFIVRRIDVTVGEAATPESIAQVTLWIAPGLMYADELLNRDVRNYRNLLDAGDLYLRAFLLGDERQRELVYIAFEGALGRGTQRPEAPLRLGTTHYLLGDLPKARTYIAQALALKPDFKEAHDFLVAHPELRE